MDQYAYLGRRLKSRRIEAGLSRQQLAQTTELDTETIGSIEAGETEGRFLYVLTLALALDLEMKVLLAEPEKFAAARQHR